MKNYFWRTTFILLILNCSLYAFAANQLKELKLGSYEVTKKDYIEFSSEDLTGGKIEMRGTIDSPDKINKVYISLDAGENWQELDGIGSFKFSFTPKEEEEYPIIIKAQGENEKVLFSKIVVAKYISVDLRNEFDNIFEELRQFYIDERLSKFLTHFDPDEYPNFSSFKDNMEDTFDDTSNFNLNVSIRQVNLQKDKNMVFVSVDWDKSFEDESSQSGTNNEIHFKRKGGMWKITYLKNEAIFVIGTGTFGGSMTG